MANIRVDYDRKQSIRNISELTLLTSYSLSAIAVLWNRAEAQAVLILAWGERDY